MKKLDGKVAMISGGSRGLGRAMALAFAREGAALALCARGAAALEAAGAAAEELGAEVLTVPADLRSERDLERFAALALDRFGRVDVLVNNASELGPTPLPALADLAPAALVDLLQVNVVAAHRLTLAVIGGMLLRRSGIVINLSSDAAVNGYPGWGGYGASKAALDALTRSWAAELEGTGVRVLAVDPGDMDTDMHRAADPAADPADLARPEVVALAFVRIAAAPPPGPRLEAGSVDR